MAKNQLQSALIMGCKLSHAPTAKRRLMQSGMPFITVEETLRGCLFTAVALNALAESLIEKPDCHYYLGKFSNVIYTKI